MRTLKSGHDALSNCLKKILNGRILMNFKETKLKVDILLNQRITWNYFNFNMSIKKEHLLMTC